MASRAVNCWIVERAQDAVMRVDAAIEHHLRECGDVAGGGEKPGVAGDAAHGPGVFVVHFALRAGACGRWRRLRWERCASAGSCGGLKRELFIPSGAKISLREFVERIAGEALDDFAEKDEAEVGVFDFLARLADERLGHHARENGFVASWPA